MGEKKKKKEIEPLNMHLRIHMTLSLSLQWPAKSSSHDNTSLLNSAFLEDHSFPVRKLLEHIVPTGVVTEDDHASDSDVYLSSEDTAEFEKVKRSLEPLLSQSAQVAELEWDTAGCALDSESCDVTEIEELVVCTHEGK